MNTEKEEQLTPKLQQDDVSLDWFLQNLSNLTNTLGLEFGITLNVSGQTISGTMIGGAKYFNLFAESFSSAWPHDDKDIIKEAFAQNSKLYEKEDGTESSPPTQYVHLMNARFHEANGAIPTNNGVLWRGKISAICGFSLGKFE